MKEIYKKVYFNILEKFNIKLGNISLRIKII